MARKLVTPNPPRQGGSEIICCQRCKDQKISNCMKWQEIGLQLFCFFLPPPLPPKKGGRKCWSNITNIKVVPNCPNSFFNSFKILSIN